MTGSEAARERALRSIEACTDPGQLKRYAENAARLGATDVERAARLRLYAVLPSAAPGTLEHDVWQSIHCLEDALTAERGKTLRLARTRQKIARDGELETVRSLVMGKRSSGFDMLIERQMSELTFEAVTLRHPDAFEPDVIERARDRLHAAGCLAD